MVFLCTRQESTCHHPRTRTHRPSHHDNARRYLSPQHRDARFGIHLSRLEFCVSKKRPHSTELRGAACHRSAKASGGEDLQVEEPVACWDFASFHFHATLAGMLSPTLIGDQVIEVRQPCKKRLLTAVWMVKRFHHEQLPLDGVIGSRW